MFRLPVRWRLTLFYTVTMAAIMALLLLAMFGMLGYLEAERLRDRVSDCAWIGESTLQGTGALNPQTMVSLGCEGVTIAALDEQGHIQSQFGYAAPIGDPYPGDIWRETLETGQVAQDSQASDEGSGSAQIQHAIPVDGDVPPVRVIVASTGYATIGQENIWIVPVIIAGVAIFALVVIAIANWFLVRSSIAPIVNITETAREITESNLSRRLPVSAANDELSRLSRTINDLLARLEIAFDEREKALLEQRRFAADASHELRTPLTSILGYTRMLKHWGLDHPETAREGINAVEQEAERMHALTESLLRLARGDENPNVSRSEQDLVALVQNTTDASRSFLPDGQHITTSIPETPVIAEIDPEMVSRALEILIDNAAKHAPSPEPIEVALTQVGDHARVQVTDHGAGIPEEHLPHIFDRLYRAEATRRTPGSGLGLAIARQVITRHNGEISVISTPGKGSTFTITLPLKAPTGELAFPA